MLPFVLNIDVEPVQRVITGKPEHWDGFPELLDLLNSKRKRLEALTGQPVRFNWSLRMDPQIEIVYGDAGWVFERYGDEIAHISAAGDGIGMHVHTWRPGKRWFRNTWVSDFADAEWVTTCLKLALDTFQKHLGKSPAHMSFGDGFMHHVAPPLMDAYGVRADCSMNPGRPSQTTGVKSEISRGKTPDYTRTPHHPFKPSKADFTVPGSMSHDFWEVPVTTGIVGKDKSGNDIRRKLLFGMNSKQLRTITAQALQRDPTCLLAECRTDVLTVESNRVRFIEALDHVEALIEQHGLVIWSFAQLCDQLEQEQEMVH